PDHAGGGDRPDLGRAVLGEPQVPVRADGDALGGAALGQAELGQTAGRRESADLGRPLLGEPHVPVRPGDDAVGVGDFGGHEGNGELGEVPVRREPADAVAPLFGEPQGPVGAGGDPVGPAVGVGQGVLPERAGRSHPADLVAGELGEPDVFVGPGDDVVGAGPVGRHRPLLDLPARPDRADPPGGELGEPHPVVGARRDPDRFAVLRPQGELLHAGDGSVHVAGAGQQRHHREDQQPTPQLHGCSSFRGRSDASQWAGPRRGGPPTGINGRSVLAVGQLVATPGEAVVEVVAAVHLHVAAAVVDHHVVAGTAVEVGRRHRAGDLEGVVAAVTDQGDAVDVVGRQVVVAGVAPHDGVAAFHADRVVAGRTADEVVAAPAVDRVVTVAADDRVVALRAVEDGGAVLAGRVEPGVAGRLAVTQPADGVSTAGVEQGEAHEEGAAGRDHRQPPGLGRRDTHDGCASLSDPLLWVAADGRRRPARPTFPVLPSTANRDFLSVGGSVLAVDEFVAAPHEAVVEVGASVDLHVTAAVVDDDVVAGPADEIRRRRRVADLDGVVAGVPADRHAVDVVGAQVVVAGVAPHHRVPARADGDAVVAGTAADGVVPAPPVDRVVAVAADDDVAPLRAVDEG